MSRQVFLGLLALLALLAASTPAMTASGDIWSPPSNLSGWVDWVTETRLDLGPDGTQVAWWVAQDITTKWSLWARVRPPGGEWGPPANLSGWRQVLGTFLTTYWDTGVGPDGTAWALWVGVDSTQSGDNVLVQSARRPPGEPWQTVVLSDGYETAVRWAGLDISPDGHLAAAWVACASSSDLEKGPCHVRVRRRQAGAPSWLPTEHADQTASGEGISKAYLLAGPGGMTTVLWLQADTSNPANWAAMGRTFKPEPSPGSWDTTPVNLSYWQTYLELAEPVTDPGGTVTAAWLTRAPDPAKTVIYASTRSAASGTWSSPPTPLSTDRGGFRLYAPTLAAGHNGTVAASWVYRAVASESYLYANVRDAGSVWGGETLVYGRASLLFGSPSWVCGPTARPSFCTACSIPATPQRRTSCCAGPCAHRSAPGATVDRAILGFGRTRLQAQPWDWATTAAALRSGACRIPAVTRLRIIRSWPQPCHQADRSKRRSKSLTGTNIRGYIRLG